MNHDKDLEICNAATDGPWKSSIFDIYKVTGAMSCLEIGHSYGEANARYIAHFNPAYIRQLIEKAKERDVLANRVEELEGALQKVLDDTEVGIVPRSHLNKIEELLK